MEKTRVAACFLHLKKTEKTHHGWQGKPGKDIEKIGKLDGKSWEFLLGIHDHEQNGRKCCGSTLWKSVSSHGNDHQRLVDFHPKWEWDGMGLIRSFLFLGMVGVAYVSMCND